MLEKKRVMVNVLNQGTTQAGLETSIIGWTESYRDKYEFQFFFPTARPIPNNRNGVVKRFLAGTWDLLFMFDDDTIPLKNPFALLDRDVDVVGGCYPGRGKEGYHFHVYDLDTGKYPDKIEFKFVPPEKREGLQKIDAIGAGCLVVKRHVLEKMVEKGLAPFEDLFDRDGLLITNDDMAFCLKCRELGIPVYADWSVLCDHIKMTSLLEVIGYIHNAARVGKAVISGRVGKFK